MNVISLYNDVLDRTATEQNGGITIEKFNRYLRLGSLRLLDYLSGDVEGQKPPEPYNNQKLRDWITILITSDPKQVVDGTSPKPSDYYSFENLKVIGSFLDENDCGESVIVSKGDTIIELLDSQQFDKRCLTYLKSLRPSMLKPIAKMMGQQFHYFPKDLGSVKLEYKRYPIHGEVKVFVDTVHNDEIPDEINSIDTEWPDFSRNMLVYFITTFYSASTREKALVEQNEVVGKSPRG